jgi:glycolate oxidase iron-sulfur subunit
VTFLREAAIDTPAAEDISQCVHCGLCLQHCPTYLQTGQETESPRGRIHLIGALNEGRIEASGSYAQHLNLCLVCRACESACPSGVPFGRIMETARTQLAARRPPTWRGRLLRWAVFEQLLPRPGRLRQLAGLLRAYQRSGLQRLVRASGLLRLIPGRLDQAEAQLPRLPSRFFTPPVDVLPAEGERRCRVGFFSGCVMPLLYPETHAATIRVLRRNGCEVVVPRGQVCCGALNVHSGERASARGLARQNLRAFLDAGLDAIVVNAAGCGSTLKEYGELLGHEPADQARAERFADQVRDVNEFLAGLDLVPPSGVVPRVVTLQESCHLAHAQRIRAAPRELLGRIPGLRLVELAHPDLCCGSAGVYSLTQPEMSERILESRMAEIEQTAADTVVTANPGCMLQLERGVRGKRLRVDVRHVVELLDESYRAGPARSQSASSSSSDAT